MKIYGICKKTDMSRNNPYFAYKEADSLAMKRKNKEDRERNQLYVEKVWQQRDMPPEVMSNIDGGIAVYLGIDKNPHGNKISAVNG